MAEDPLAVTSSRAGSSRPLTCAVGRLRRARQSRMQETRQSQRPARGHRRSAQWAAPLDCASLTGSAQCVLREGRIWDRGSLARIAGTSAQHRAAMQRPAKVATFPEANQSG
jgi:hypothetical protein